MSQDHYQEQQPPKKRSWFSRLSPRTRVILGIVIIAILCVLAFKAPPEGSATNATGDLATTPTVSVTHLMSTITINRSVTVMNSMHITLTQVSEATKFSDDRKPAGVYTVRVQAQAVNEGQSPVGIRYDAITRLILPNGEAIAPKYISLLPDALPHRLQQGFFDFPVSTPLPLASLTLSFGGTTAVAFSG